MSLTEKGAATGKTQLSRRGKNRRNLFLLIVVIAVVIAVSHHGGTNNAAAPPADQASSLNTLASTIKSDLATCTAATDDALTAVGLIVQDPNSVSDADLVQLDSISKDAQTACDETKDNDILNLGSVGVPGSISGIDNLGDAPLAAESWASDDVAAVLHDIQNIAESNGSDVADASRLQSDEATADQASSSVRGSFSQAASQFGVAMPSLGLLTFGG